MRIGYARVSRQQDQDTTTQVKALKDAGAERIYQEHASGGRWDRPELHRLTDQLRPGDVLVVWKLDGLNERKMIRERTRAGLDTARAQGRIGGRRPELTAQQAELVRSMQEERYTQVEAARLFGVHPATVSRLMAGQTKL